MKTLIIHPEDPTTEDFTVVYAGFDFTVSRGYESNSKLMGLIKDHDRIIMLGHGSEKGLFDLKRNRIIVNSKAVYKLREKDCVFIWCNADKFVKRYGLKGLNTGMIISEYSEAVDYCVKVQSGDIEKSNKRLSESLRKGIKLSTKEMYELVLSTYDIETPIGKFNRNHIYFR